MGSSKVLAPTPPWDLVIVRVRPGRDSFLLMTCYNLIGIYFLFQLRSACFSSGLRPREMSLAYELRSSELLMDI